MSVHLAHLIGIDDDKLLLVWHRLRDPILWCSHCYSRYDAELYKKVEICKPGALEPGSLLNKGCDNIYAEQQRK